MKLSLIGLRGTGKSTVGYMVARKLNWKFLDTDMLVQDHADMTIKDIFEKFGEAHFRKIESEVVQECALHEQAVIATGGGAVLDPNNVAALRKNGFVVHLSASPEELWHRISTDRNSVQTRPSLVANAGSGVEELRQMMLARASAYVSARDAELSVERHTPEQVADAVLQLMRQRGLIAPA
jgi:shikimate kinase